ncbi:MAG: hypothetical protein LBK61_11005 [Spirochaetaceae bacterium]|nr:hypothetical protein [Spirochaetaceae bacterium]
MAKLSHFMAYKKQPSSHNEANLKGQIYELFCYNEIIKANNNILKSNCVSKEKYGNFSYSKLGKINYHSNNIHLAEFDILGIKDNSIYFFEITMSEHNKKIFRNEIDRKNELLKKIFNNYEIIFTLILPKNIIGLDCYDIKIIDEPDYNKYMDNEYFVINNAVNKCKSLKEFSECSTEYNYIEDIISISKKYFQLKDKSPLYKQHLIERIYDMNHIAENSFAYFSIENKKYGEINIKDNRIFKDGKIVKGIKKCNNEIKLIRKMYKTNWHFA